jgi:hypothetical protein
MKSILRLLFALGILLVVSRTARGDCTATEQCYDGSSVSCTGASTCSSSGWTVARPYVTCDSVRTTCAPYCPDSQVCNTASDCFSFCNAQGLHGACPSSSKCCYCF